MTIHFDNAKLEESMSALADRLDTSLIKDCQELSIKLPTSVGKGSITAFTFDYGISLMLFNCQLKENLKIVYRAEQTHPVHFNFCLNGDFRHSLAEGAITYQLNPLAGSITTNPNSCSQSFDFPKGMAIRHANLQVLRSAYLEKVDCDVTRMPDKLAEVFQEVEGKKPFLYEGNYTVSTSACIKSILDTTHEGLVRSAYTEAKSLEIFSLQLKQFEDDLNPKHRFIALKKYDLDRILAAKELLILDLQNAPTIVELAKRSGINQQKLKKGFKQVFDQTINQYLRNTRLETAKFMLIEGKSSIQDISKKVGYSNQSHFARRFKEKYGLLPKDVRSIYLFESN